MVNYLKKIEEYSNIMMFKTLDGNKYVNKSYSDYLHDVQSSAYLLEKTIGPVEGKHIGIIARSGYEYYVLLTAIMFSRAVAVPINENETENNIAFAVKNAEVNVLLVEADRQKYIYDNVITLPMDEILEKTENEKVLKDFDESEAHDLVLILYTSGTTSLSKGVALSADSLFRDYISIFPDKYLDNLEAVRGKMIYTSFPCYHLGGMLVMLNYCEAGCTICCSKDPRNVLSDLENIKVDFAAVSPAVVKLWANCLKHNRIDRLGMVKYIITGGAKIEPDLVNIFDTNGISLAQLYGQTESGGVVVYNNDMKNHGDSIGKPLKGARISIVEGEICIEYWGNMLGYYKNPEETEKCLRDGVVYSGDLGYIDEDGYIYMTGRKKNLIILSGGENVSPEEIETALYENPHIKECRVYENNDSIYADIYAPGLSQDEVKGYVQKMNKTMPFYKRINHIVYKASELEKTSIGKIKR